MARYGLVASILIIAVLVAAATGAQAKATPTRFDAARFRTAHPRIWLDDGRIAWLRSKCEGKTGDDLLALTGNNTMGKALAYVISGDEKTGREAVTEALRAGRGESGTATLALVYDWCYPVLSDEDKKTMRQRMTAAARGLIDFKRNWRSFHNGLYSSAWQLTAITAALYGEDPIADESWAWLKPELEDVMLMFENLFPDGEYHEGVDYNRHGSYEALKFFWAIKTATGLDVMKDSPHMRNTALFILYGAKPDGLNLLINDNDWPFTGWWEREALLLSAAEFDNPYAQYALVHSPVPEFMPAGRNKWIEMLWFDPLRQEKPLSELPKSRLFRGMGLVIARTGWGWDTRAGLDNTAWLTFRCGDYFGDHCHYDQNMFTINYKGPLAIDSGRYDPDWNLYNDADFTKSQMFNYYHRTIAHNTILVYDPDEKFAMPVANDGGQRQLLFKDGKRNVPEDYSQGTFPSDDGVGTCDWATNPGRWETGDLRAYRATGDFMYVCGDATAAYDPAKMKSFVRQLVFVYPDVVIAFDRVVSAKPEFRKTWVLQSISEPAVAGDNSSFTVTHRGGSLACHVLLPAKRSLDKVGLPNEDGFLVNGVTFGFGESSAVTKEPLHMVESATGEVIGEAPGKWRMEECPTQPASEDYFLNVMTLSDAGAKDQAHIMNSEDADSATAMAHLKSGAVVTARFAKGEVPGLTLRIEKDGQVVFDGALLNEIVP